MAFVDIRLDTFAAIGDAKALPMTSLQVRTPNLSWPWLSMVMKVKVSLSKR